MRVCTKFLLVYHVFHGIHVIMNYIMNVMFRMMMMTMMMTVTMMVMTLLLMMFIDMMYRNVISLLKQFLNATQ